MKILALRGENLASLQSRFEIDFATSRLGDAGLFAITGKTGAGKSTLLDAICLALYGGIPRLQANKKNDAEIGHDDDTNRMKANDVRSILSRGKGEAFAEVDFIANDGTRWCAHWSVRRARGRASGRIQSAEQWLENLDTTQRITGKKQAFQEEIQRLIGLNFEQFRRAVMLPQGEFAAFLKAGTDERATLLERMTGGEIYSQLSVLTHERARTEKEAYQQLQAKLGDVALLSTEDKQTLTAQIAQLKHQSQQLSNRLGELKQHQAVLTAAEALAQRVAETQTATQAAQQQLAAAAPRYQHLALLDQVQPARSDYSLLQQAHTQLSQLQQTLARSQSELPSKEQAMLNSNQQVVSDSKLLAKAQQGWKRLEPDLRQALKLDQRLESLHSQHFEQEKAQQAQQQQVVKQTETLQKYHAEQDKLQQRQQELIAKLAQNQHNKTVVEHYDSVRDNLKQYTTAQQAQTKLAADQQQIINQQQTHQQQQAETTSQLAALRKEKAVCEAQHSAADLSALEQLQQREQAQYADKQQFRDLLRQAMAALKEWLSVRQQAEKSEQEQFKLEASLKESQQNLTDLLPRIETLRIQYDECKHLLQKSREVMNLSDHRAELTSGEACPLCGSPEHPYAIDHPLAEGLLQAQQQRLEALEQALSKNAAQRLQLEKSLPEERKRLLNVKQETTDLKQQISTIHQRYDVLFDSLERGATLHEQAEIPVLQQQITAWEQSIADNGTTLANLHTANEKREQQITARKAVQNQLQQLQEQENTLNLQLQRFVQDSTKWQERRQALDIQHKVQTGILQTRSTALQAQFGRDSWQQDLQELGEQEFLQQLNTTVKHYVQDQQTRQDTEQQLVDLAPQIAAIQKTLEHTRQQLQQQASGISTLLAQSTDLQQQRTTLLAEQDLAQLQAEHEQAIDTAQKNVEAAQTAQRETGEKLAAFKATLTGMQHQQTEVEAKLQGLNQRWAGWQQELSLDESELTELLHQDEDWLAAEREALKIIEQTAESGQVRLKERQQDLQEQEKLALASRQWLAEQGITEDSGQQYEWDDRDERASAWQQQQAELDEQVFQCRQQLSADEQARTKAGSLTQQLNKQQRHHELWQKMNELIGSANGSKFRSLAQSLTLQQLVILANQHLQNLAPRYALQTVPGSGLALQIIDHDMGDEVRSVESLSGGESFLTSLALALALASLTADTRQLESLFIDEGFGTLDPDSLEMALACLDALQADGRQIGVISHVSTLMERIGVQIRVEAMGGGRSRVRVAVD